MLIILILLLTFTDFEKLNCLDKLLKVCFCKIRIDFFKHIVYIYWQPKSNKQVHSENLTPGQIFFKKGLICLVWRNSFSKELFRNSLYTHIYAYIRIYTHMYAYIRIYTHIYAYIRIYTHIYAYIRIYTHIYAYT